MKKYTITLLLSVLTLFAFSQETPPPMDANFKQLSTSQFYLHLPDSVIWQYKGITYGWARIAKYKDVANLNAIKVDKVAGKGLSTNDYTTAEKNKLAQQSGVNTGDQDLSPYQLKSEKGANNGYAPLDAGGKVPFSNLPASLMIYKGLWNPTTNTPALNNSTGTAGWVYKASVAGSANLGSGSISFFAGDFVIHNGTVWERSVGTDNVVSVNGQQGVVILSKADVGLGNVDNTSDINKPVSTSAQAAINGKANLIGGNTFSGNQTFSGTIIGTAINLTNMQLTAGGDIAANGYLSISGTGAFGSTVSSPAVPTSDNHLTNKAYVDGKLLGKANLAGGNTFTGDQTINGAIKAPGVTIGLPGGDDELIKLKGATPYTSYYNNSASRLGFIQHDGTNFQFVNDIPAGGFSFGSPVFFGYTPTLPTHAVNKGYVDASIATGKTIGANTTGSAVTWTNAGQYINTDVPANTYMMGLGGDGSWHPIGLTNLRSFLGTPSGGETLTSVTSRGNKTPSSVQVGDATISSGVSYSAGSDYAGIFGTFTNHPTILYTNGVEKIRILQNGNVGIGTSTPSSKLHVISSGSITPFVVQGANGSIVIDNVGSGENYYYGSSKHVFQSSIGTIAQFNSDGSAGFAGVVSVGTPAAPNHAATKAYVDGIATTKQNVLTLTTTGNGTATLNGNTLNIPTPSASSNVTSGEYLPTFSNFSNVTAVSTSSTNGYYMRIGNYVTVTGFFNVTSTGSSSKSFDMSLPIATTNAAINNGILFFPGFGNTDDGTRGQVFGAGSVANVSFTSPGTGSNFKYTFTYKIQ